MTQLVQFKTPLSESGDGDGLLAVNPDHVVLVEPVSGRGRPTCRLWLALPLGGEVPENPCWTVVGLFAEVLKQLRASSPERAGDLLGRVGGSR